MAKKAIVRERGKWRQDAETAWRAAQERSQHWIRVHCVAPSRAHAAAAKPKEGEGMELPQAKHKSHAEMITPLSGLRAARTSGKIGRAFLLCCDALRARRGRRETAARRLAAGAWLCGETRRRIGDWAAEESSQLAATGCKRRLQTLRRRRWVMKQGETACVLH